MDIKICMNTEISVELHQEYFGWENEKIFTLFTMTKYENCGGQCIT